jgi:hypothetical protein
MRINLSDTEAVAMLSILNERMKKYSNLAQLAEARMKDRKFSKNAERLIKRHMSKVETAKSLINKVAGQL